MEEPGAGPPENPPLQALLGTTTGLQPPGGGVSVRRRLQHLGVPRCHTREVGSIQYPRSRVLCLPTPHSTQATSTAGASPPRAPVPSGTPLSGVPRLLRGTDGEGAEAPVGPLSPSPLPSFPPCSPQGAGGTAEVLWGEVRRGLGAPRFPGLAPSGPGCGGGEGALSAGLARAGVGEQLPVPRLCHPARWGGGQGAAAGVRVRGGGARRGHIWPFRRRRSPARRPGSRSLGCPVPARRRP